MSATPTTQLALGAHFASLIQTTTELAAGEVAGETPAGVAFRTSVSFVEGKGKFGEAELMVFNLALWTTPGGLNTVHTPRKFVSGKV